MSTTLHQKQAQAQQELASTLKTTFHSVQENGPQMVQDGYNAAKTAAGNFKDQAQVVAVEGRDRAAKILAAPFKNEACSLAARSARIKSKIANAAYFGAQKFGIAGYASIGLPINAEVAEGIAHSEVEHYAQHCTGIPYSCAWISALVVFILVAYIWKLKCSDRRARHDAHSLRSVSPDLRSSAFQHQTSGMSLESYSPAAYGDDEMSDGDYINEVLGFSNHLSHHANGDMRARSSSPVSSEQARSIAFSSPEPNPYSTPVTQPFSPISSRLRGRRFRDALQDTPSRGPFTPVMSPFFPGYVDDEVLIGENAGSRPSFGWLHTVTSPVRSLAGSIAFGLPSPVPSITSAASTVSVLEDEAPAPVPVQQRSPVRRGNTPVPIRDFVRNVGGQGEECSRCNRIHTRRLSNNAGETDCISAAEQSRLADEKLAEDAIHMAQRAVRIARARAYRARNQ